MGGNNSSTAECSKSKGTQITLGSGITSNCKLERSSQLAESTGNTPSYMVGTGYYNASSLKAGFLRERQWTEQSSKHASPDP